MKGFLYCEEINKIALKDSNGDCVTYGELNSTIENVNNQVETRNIVLFLANSSIGSYGGFYILYHLGLVPIMLDAKLSAEYLKVYINLYEPKYIWMPVNDDNFIDQEIVFTWNDYKLIVINEDSNCVHKDLAVLLSTSGSTGNPKLVRISYKNLEQNVNLLCKSVSMNVNDIGISNMPMFYSYGFAIMNMHYCCNGTMYITKNNILQPSFWNDFRREGITNLAGVPYVYELLEKIGFLNEEYPSLRFMTQTGGKLSLRNQLNFAKTLLEKKVNFYIWYGQTEATGGITVLENEQIIDKIGSIGKPFNGLDVYIIPCENSELFTNISNKVVGELCIRGQSISMGYALNKYDLIKEDNFNNNLQTGDIAYCDKENYWYLVGRKSRFIKVLGKRINLDDMEEMIKNRFGYAECICTGEDENVLVCYRGVNKNKDIFKYLKKEIHISEQIAHVYCVEEIIRKESGKPDYIAMQKKYMTCSCLNNS